MVFGFIKKTLEKIYTSVSSPLKALFARPIDEQTLNELETILLRADTGVATTKKIMDTVTSAWQHGRLKEGSDLHTILQEKLTAILTAQTYTPKGAIYLLVGINGSGKTTAAAKLAYQQIQEKKRVLFVAADTFRAAAPEQLTAWANQLAVDVVTGAVEQDPASVVFSGIQRFKQGGYDTLIIDTAGRLQTKIPLMKELEKIRRVIHAQLPECSITTLLTVDAMLGQNSFTQAKIFHESTPLSGIILTKMDGTGKGGIVFSIVNELHIPIAYISYGEKPEQFKRFNPDDYVHDLLG